jgi:hypothetical protein
LGEQPDERRPRKTRSRIPETLRSPRFGATVYHKKGSLPPAPMAVPYIGDKALLALQHFDQVREMRTGRFPLHDGAGPRGAAEPDRDGQPTTRKDAAYSQIELIARNQAELGWKRVFRQILKLIVKHQDRPRTIRLRDTMGGDGPASWNANMDATINIGLGTGSRDRDMAMLNQILNVQMAMTDRLAQGGFSAQALEMVPKINMTATKLAESAGIKNPDQFYLDIKPEMLEQMKQEAANRPDPEMQKEQMKAQTADAGRADEVADALRSLGSSRPSLTSRPTSARRRLKPCRCRPTSRRRTARRKPRWSRRSRISSSRRNWRSWSSSSARIEDGRA